MKYFIFVFFILFIIVSCYQYVEERSETRPIAVDVPLIKPADLLDASIKTKSEIVTATISLKEPTVSQAITNTIIRHFRGKGINVARVSKKTIYQILNTIPRRTFASKNLNKVLRGETFTFKMSVIVHIKITGDNYYLMRDRIYGRDNLKKAIAIKWLKPYEAHVFDCSEKSAFMEFWLERNGFNADIVADATHSWIKVEVEPGNWVDVEATGDEPSIMPWRKYNNRFKDIYMAIQYYGEEYDWWNSIKQGEKIIGR